MTQKRFRRLLMSCGVSRRTTDAYVKIVQIHQVSYADVLRGLATHSLYDRWVLYAFLDCHAMVRDPGMGCPIVAERFIQGGRALQQVTVMAREIMEAIPPKNRSRIYNISRSRGKAATVRIIKSLMVEEDKEQ